MNTFVDLVWQCLLTKIDVVVEDELEGGRRQILNLGHTLAHALEGLNPGIFTHGEAVLFGLQFVCRLSLALNIGEIDFIEQVEAIIDSLSLDFQKLSHIAFEDLKPYFACDKKRSGRGLAWILPVSAGETIVQTGISDSDLETVWSKLVG